MVELPVNYKATRMSLFRMVDLPANYKATGMSLFRKKLSTAVDEIRCIAVNKLKLKELGNLYCG